MRINRCNARLWLCGTLCLSAGSALAQPPHAGIAREPAQTLPTVVVTATQRPDDAFDLPASIDAIHVPDKLRIGASVAEVLAETPGVMARDRHNYAQDTQIAIRGFGARSAFGIRGIRLLTDGIPASQPDGQGQVSHFALAAADRIEVLRGPFAMQYGNASGGVIQLFTADGEGEPQWRVNGAAGSFGNARLGINARGQVDAVRYNIDAGTWRIDGFRPHSSAQRSGLNLKIDYAQANNGKLTLIGNALEQPWTQDPLGLNAAQFAENPYQTAPQASQFNTRKRVRQAQAGAIYERPFGEDQLRLMLYAGTREVGQFLAIPATVQAPPRHAGGEIALDNGYGGADLRWTRDSLLANRVFSLSAGMATDTLEQQRRGYENFVGPVLGVRGRLRRDEVTRVRSVDAYAQAQWDVHPRWRLLAGARHSQVSLDTRDDYLAAGNPDDSGRVRFRATTPTAGVLFRASPRLHLHVSAGRGFETPTIAELAYRADGAAGLALDLRPMTSRNGELGVKWRGPSLQAQASLFRSRSKNELAVATSVGGRTTYRNVAGAARDGAEFAAQWQFLPDWELAATYTQVRARFTTAFLGCSARCTQPDTPVAAGSAIAGVPRSHATLALRWQPRMGWSAALDARRQSAVPVNDVGSEAAPGYAIVGAEARYTRAIGNDAIRLFLRADNLANKRHAASVIYNDGNGRYYEPGPGRNWSLGLEWQFR